MNKDTGGSAFPLVTSTREEDHYTGHVKIIDTREAEHGITMRDYFAAKCCAAMISTIRNDNDYMRLRHIAEGHDLDTVSQFFAQEAYKQADAMLEARKK